MRRLVRTVLPSAEVLQGAVRTSWDPNGHQPESFFMDRKDLAHMYPTQKPWTTAGDFGYQRGVYWNIFLTPNPVIRLPHERRRLNPKKAKVVTVFGASGWLGIHIVRELLANPDIETVRVTTRYPMHIPAGSDLEKLLEEGGNRIELHECDVADRIQVNVAANGADTLIHAVDYHSEFSGNSHHDVYVIGASNVAYTARHVRAERVIFCSGLDSTFASESNYVDMRFRAEEAVAANFADATILRFGPLYGKHYRYRGLGKYIYPASWSGSRVQPTWVVDAARAVVRCTRSQRAIRYKLDLGGPQNMTHLQFMQLFSSHYHKRLVFPLHKGVGLFFGKLLPWIIPRPWFDDNWVITWELDQVNRNPAIWDRLASWSQIGLKPHSMEEATAIDFAGAKIEDLNELNKAQDALEAQDVADLAAEEEAAKKSGIYRSKAEPGHGRADGMELVAQEIYPGEQFRIRALENAKYPSTVKNPHPVAIH